MRNLAVYPVTTQEKIEALDWALSTYWAQFKTQDEIPIGSILPVALEELLDEQRLTQEATT